MPEPSRPHEPIVPARRDGDRPTTIGVLSQSTGGFFYGRVLAGVVAEVGAAGGRVLLLQTLDAGQVSGFLPVSDCAEPVGWNHIDGFVNIAWATGRDFTAQVQASGKPMVFASNVVEHVDAATVVTDNAGGVREAVAHLVGHGHRHIGFVGNVNQGDVAERRAAYREAMLEHGLEPLEHMSTSDQLESGGAGAALALAVTSPRWTAVIAGTDRVAIGVMAGLRECGIAIPADIAVIGFDDAEVGWYSDPPLTTIRQDFAEVGSTAAGLVLAETRGLAVRHERHTVPVEFVVRHSCGCSASPADLPSEGASEASALLNGLGAVLGVGGPGAASLLEPRPLAEVDLAQLDETISKAIEHMLRTALAPEEVEGFAGSAIRQIAATASRLPNESAGRRTLQHAAARVTALLSRQQMILSGERIRSLAQTLGNHFEVGMSLLGRALGDDPTNLRWLATVGVRAGCLGLWADEGHSALRIAGAYDPTGSLDRLVGSTTPLADFPPSRVLELADATQGEVVYLIPVRGASGDHGLFCLVAPINLETEARHATYDHWVALLGTALREQRLLSELRQSEQRYAHASRAAADGLWEWDVVTGDVYVSDRARDLLGLATGESANATSIMDVHEDDRALVREALAAAVNRPEHPVEVEARVAASGDQATWVLIRALGVAGDDGRTRGLVGSISDIGQRKALEEQLRRAALFDQITGLPNRRLFLDRLGQALEHPRRRKEARFAVLFLDLDGFKLINDSLGHLAGDQLLQEVGRRLRSELRSVDTAARFGGDEFALLLSDPVPEELLVVASRIQKRIAEPITLGVNEVTVTASIGIAASESGYSEPEDVLRDADIAMYHAKEREPGSASLFDPAMHERAVGRLQLRTALLHALAEKQFVVHYQPVVALDGSALSQFEALVRWDHPERGILLPGEFLPAMEGNATIITLGHQVLETVCAQIAEWRRTYSGSLSVSVNLAHREFWARDMVATVRSTLARFAVPAECLIIELTESVVMTDPDAARGIMAELHAAGIRLHIDDFGTGQSSLYALRTFPVDALKIDGSFIREMTGDDPTGAALVRTILSIGDALGIGVVAECVETSEQANALRGMGCATAQGWLYARAMPGERAGSLLGTAMGEGQKRVVGSCT